MTDFRGCTPFVVACQQGHLKDVDRFISISLHDDVNEIEKCSLKDLVNQVGSSDGCRSTSAISAAAIAGHFDIVHYLVKHGANAAGTPLVCASEKGRIEDVNILITKHDVESSGMTSTEMVNQRGKDSRGIYGYTALMMAAEKVDFDMSASVLKSSPQDKVDNLHRHR
mgnify:CR=1 FL=1